METSAWISRVAAAQSSGAVLHVVHEYLRSHDAANLASLPAECRPPPLHSAADVGGYAYTLARHPPPCDGAPLIDSLGAFFARASIRLAEIEAPTFTSRPPDARRTGDPD